MTKLTDSDLINYGLIGAKSAKRHKGINPPERKHDEANLHLQFCKWVRHEYPELKFVKHEREKSRSYANQNMFQVYNSDDMKLPDFELLHYTTKLPDTDSGTYVGRDGFIARYTSCSGGGSYFGLYIEFKRPDRQWQSNGKIKADCLEQYLCHQHLWSIGRCAYFANDLETAKKILISYLSGTPIAKQEYIV